MAVSDGRKQDGTEREELSLLCGVSDLFCSPSERYTRRWNDQQRAEREKNLALEALASGGTTYTDDVGTACSYGVASACPQASDYSELASAMCSTGGFGLSPFSVVRPTNVSDSGLQNLVKYIYHGEGRLGQIGTGSTADAIRNEIRTGQPTSGVWHGLYKGPEGISALNNWLRKNPSASSTDRSIANNLLRDLTDAMQSWNNK